MEPQTSKLVWGTRHPPPSAVLRRPNKAYILGRTVGGWRCPPPSPIFSIRVDPRSSAAALVLLLRGGESVFEFVGVLAVSGDVDHHLAGEAGELAGGGVRYHTD